MADPVPRKKHIILPGPSQTFPFRAPPRKIDAEKRLPKRDRESHGNKLLSELSDIVAVQQDVIKDRQQHELPDGDFLYLELSGGGKAGDDSYYDFFVESVESAGIEILAIERNEQGARATIYVPDGMLAVLEKKLRKYLEQETEKGNPRYRDLVESIESIRRATFESLWFDSAPPSGDETTIKSWEIWLSSSAYYRNEKEISKELNDFKTWFGKVDIATEGVALLFPDRAVIRVKANLKTIRQNIMLIEHIAEIRDVRPLNDQFMGMEPNQQLKWSDELLKRLILSKGIDIKICILDTGINRTHPLLSPFLDKADTGSHDVGWGEQDHDGHGTNMAGAALFGDLAPILASKSEVEVTARLESQKILPPAGANDKELYGHITEQAVYRAEIQDPKSRRIVLMAITEDSSRLQGEPTSWSAAIDKLVFNSGGEKRLIILASGQVGNLKADRYYEQNYTTSIESPAQAWNAIVVGGVTEKLDIDTENYPNRVPAAKLGGLSPQSPTSMVWDGKWPIKPDVVFEAGNYAIDKGTNTLEDLESLQLLGPDYLAPKSYFNAFSGTSAASALAAKFLSEEMRAYPELRAEACRGLMIHSARWSDGMLQHVGELDNKNKKRELLRVFGYGTPNIDKALWTKNNCVTYISQATLQPYAIGENGIRFGDMHFYDLPWPLESLRELSELPIAMRITLSYFVEPNPSSRGLLSKYGYGSANLRFDVKPPTESVNDFLARKNDELREDGWTAGGHDKHWLLGPQARDRGSMMADVWTGTAAELASMGKIVIYPVRGWWRSKKRIIRDGAPMDYALLVTLETQSTEIDILSEVTTQIELQNKIEIPVRK